MVDDGREDMRGDGMGGTCGVAREEKATRCQFLLYLFTCESLFGGVCINMQYDTHGLYFMKRNIEMLL